MSDCSKGKIMVPATYIAMMVGLSTLVHDREEEKDIRDDVEVLRFLQTHKYGNGLIAKMQYHIYRRAKNYRWIGEKMFKMLQ